MLGECDEPQLFGAFGDRLSPRVVGYRVVGYRVVGYRGSVMGYRVSGPVADD